MSKNSNFSKSEIELILNQAIIQEKLLVLKKITELLQQLGFDAEKQIDPFLDTKKPKVSKGENLNGYPFRVLDYPRIFTEKNVFAFRTLFWWGNFVSFTLHLKGTFLNENYKKLAQLTHRYPCSLYLSTDGNEWSHDINEKNYFKLNAKSLSQITIKESSFLKIVQQEPISQINNISKSYYQFLNRLIVPLCNDRI